MDSLNVRNTKLPSLFGVSLKSLSLITLSVQNSSVILLMRYSRILPGNMYLASTAVFLSELLKLSVCLFVYFKNRVDSGTPFASISFRSVFDDIFGPGSDALKLAIPAILYTIQNNLQYLAVSKLDAATFQVTYQMKILTTALVSVLMLGKKLTALMWVSLMILTFGVILVQLPSGSTDQGKKVNSAGDNLVGLLVVSIACCLSALAGVYFEKILKKAPSNTDSIASKSPPSIWVRNIQLAFFGSIIAGIFGIFVQDYDLIMENGFWYGYNLITFLVIFSQAFGGLLVAMVVKYADNILKGFATCISIIISSVFSVWLFDFQLSWTFFFGCLFVIYSTFLYNVKPTVAPENWKEVMLAMIPETFTSKLKYEPVSPENK